MCLIIQKPENVQIPGELIKSAYSQNNDGWGIMYAADKKLTVSKGMELEDLIANINALPTEIEFFVHLRMATHGTICAQNTHPFDVVVEENGDRIISMMHNGVINNIASSDEDASDTKNFVTLISSHLKHYPDLIWDKGWQQLIQDFIGKNNRLTFLTKDGRWLIFNYDQGINWQGLWLSNTYAWDYRNQELIAEGTWSSYVGAKKTRWQMTQGLANDYADWYNERYQCWEDALAAKNTQQKPEEDWRLAADYEEVEEVESCYLTIDDLLALDKSELKKVTIYEPEAVFDCLSQVSDVKFWKTEAALCLWASSSVNSWQLLKNSPLKVFDILEAESLAQRSHQKLKALSSIEAILKFDSRELYKIIKEAPQIVFNTLKDSTPSFTHKAAQELLEMEADDLENLILSQPGEIYAIFLKELNARENNKNAETIERILEMDLTDIRNHIIRYPSVVSQALWYAKKEQLQTELMQTICANGLRTIRYMVAKNPEKMFDAFSKEVIARNEKK